MTKTGLLMFAHGARDTRWAEPFEQVAAAVRAARPAQPVRLAFLEFMAPDIRTAAAELAREGCTRIDVLPLFLGAGGHVRKDLPPLLDELRRRHAGVTLTLHPAVGEAPALMAAMAAIALDLPDTP
ncbi:MAG: CbiX/SirB N-terminal domain-containing protein [Burkholderiaceae bacterium]|nr:CbiX/SirB N-terminal domain-containing protein [Burkholderiaceae bacterium]